MPPKGRNPRTTVYAPAIPMLADDRPSLDRLVALLTAEKGIRVPKGIALGIAVRREVERLEAGRAIESQP